MVMIVALDASRNELEAQLARASAVWILSGTNGTDSLEVWLAINSGTEAKLARAGAEDDGPVNLAELVRRESSQADGRGDAGTGD